MKNYVQFIKEKRISYKKELCQKIWDDKTLIPRIEEKLLKIAKDFFEELKLDTEIIDIELVGSMANYNYTESSDIDLHIMIDFSEINDDINLVKKAVDGQRFIWNLRHNIVIQGHDVELYVQHKTEEHISAGTYSVLYNKWIKMPVYNPPSVDTTDIDPKYDAMVYDINELEKMSKSDLDPTDAELYYKKAKQLKEKIQKSRKHGLSESGEFSIENLVFKRLRNKGQIEKLINTITRLYDMIYSQ